ncbi:MAG: TIGR03087 family PEP-CTERM/XrtA system glycosyltransferase, partial [Pirellulales bacterium]|nr:TIGR03087 family PEP-CTERM/XrtA system glycosyltransferase [Pirellulales bacterium]
MNDGRPQILFLVHRVPHPPNRGDRIRSFHLLRFLAARADVHLAYLSEDPPPAETIAVLDGLCRNVAAVRLGRRRRWLAAARTVGLGRTATEGLFCSGALRRLVTNWASRIQFDAVVVFCSSMVQYLDARELKGVPVVVDLVDVDSQKWLDYAARARGLRRFLFNLEGRRLRRLERALPKRARAVTLVSQSEVDLYRGFCPTDVVHAIPNGVDLDYFQPANTIDGEREETCVFIGALDYRANLDGVSWFCEHVWPQIRRRRPEARFELVGSRPGVVARRLGALPGVELIGPVEDVRPSLRAAQVVVA